jgi:chemotaxis protein MotB
MWILGQSEEVKQSVSSYFKDPGAFNFITGKRTSPIDLNLQPKAEGEGKGKNKEDFKFFPMDEKDTTVKVVTSKEQQKAMQDSIAAAAKVSSTAEEIKKYLNDELSKRPDLKDILSSIKIEMTKEGLRIELIETQESLFFEVGSAKVSPKAREVLLQLAKELGKLQNYIEIEGHTDSRKYSGSGGYSNWDLSTDRAQASRRILETSLWEGQVSKVTGFADRMLRNPNNPFDMSNRRISLLVKQLKINDLLPSNTTLGGEQHGSK